MLKHKYKCGCARYSWFDLVTGRSYNERIFCQKHKDADKGTLLFYEIMDSHDSTNFSC